MTGPLEKRLELSALVGGASVDCTAHWSSNDPLWVLLTFEGGGREVTWHVSREGLTVGMELLDGGDVGVSLDFQYNITTVTLRSPDGVADVNFSTAILGGWLEETHRIVPIGSETHEWERLLGRSDPSGAYADCIVCKEDSQSRSYMDGAAVENCPSCGRRLR